MLRPGVLLAGLVAVAVVAIAVIPLPRLALDFGAVGETTPAASGDGTAATFRQTRWPELVPEGWNPDAEFRRLQQGIRDLPDSDTRAIDALKKMREVWSNAPTNPAIDGARVRIPGYVVPLQETRRGLTEFLLVPYFGACIHSPPPPSNQIIHVRLKQARPNMRAMDVVWISGTIRGERSESGMGASSYAMNAIVVEPYVAQER